MMAGMPAALTASAAPSLLHTVAHLRWPWLLGAVAAELGSMTSSARS
jgi:hypothetical protein